MENLNKTPNENHIPENPDPLKKKTPFKKIIPYFLGLVVIGILAYAGTYFLNNDSTSDKEKLLNEIQTTMPTDSEEECASYGDEPYLTQEECIELGGEVINTADKEHCWTTKNFLGTVTGLRCPCICYKK